MVAKITIEGHDDLEVVRVLQAWGPRYAKAIAKRTGSKMRGRTRYAVRKRSGRLRRSVVAGQPRINRGYGRGAVATGQIASFRVTSKLSPPPDRGYFTFVERAIGRWTRSYDSRRTAGSVGRATMRKVASEQNARTAAAGR